MLTLDQEQEVLAFDRATSRTFDALSGHLHVKLTNISKATVNPYNGSEISGCDELGLNPNRVYMLLRHPEELAKAADSFDGKPLLEIHKPMFATDHDHEVTVGSVSGVIYDHPYLKANLAVWSGDAIRSIEDETQKELSCGYGYTADMTPGTYEGVKYDGIMRDIRGNHVALVAEGRAGPDVMVGDSMENLMKTNALSRVAAHTHGALAVYLRPKLAADQKVDLGPVVAGLTAKNYKARQGKLAHDLKKLVKDKLAADASLEDVGEVIEALAEILPEEVPEVVEEMGGTEEEGETPAAEDEASEEEVMAYLASKLTDEQMAKVKAMLDCCSDDDTPAPPPAMDTKNMVTKTAMDAAIRVAADAAFARATAEATRVQREIRDAEKAVRPYVGDLALAHDSAEEVYRTALTSLGQDVKDVHPSAFPTILAMLPKAGDAPKRAPAPIAQDAASRDEATKLFPNMNRLSA